MFVGRKHELDELKALFDSDHFEMPVIYGRRRTGKTRLISEFISNKPAIYFQARRTNAAINLQLLSGAIFSHLGASAGTFNSFDEAFDTVARLSQDKRLILVIDEYPYLAQSWPEISSLLQEKIDHVYKDNTKLMLILCGSSLSFMEEQVLGYQSPLYGRRTAQLRIGPLDYNVARKLWPDCSAIDSALYYGICGGTPAYLEKIDPLLGVEGNIKRLFLNPRGYLYEEPSNLLLQECSKPEQYDAIVQAVASGKSKVNEIATTTSIPESNTSSYLKRLKSLGIIQQQFPLGETAHKKGVYRLADPMFRFWYRTVPQNIALIENEMPDLAYERIAPLIDLHMGSVFEEICMQEIVARMRAGMLEFPVVRMGSWWGTDPRTRSQEEIDIMADDGGTCALFAECKWRNELTGSDVLAKLIERSELFRYSTRTYYLFSKSGFTQGCKDLAAQRGDVTLLTINDMLH